MQAAASMSYTCLSTCAVIAALLSDLIPSPQFSSGPGAGTRLTTCSVSVASHTKSVAVTEGKLLRQFDKIPRVTSGNLEGDLTAKKKKKTWSWLKIAGLAGPLLPAMGTRGTIFTCADERWNSVIQYSFLQLVQMRGELSKIFIEGWNTVQYSFVMQLVQMRGGTHYNIVLCNLCKWGVEHNTTFFCYSTCVDDVKLVQMRGGTQYNIHLLCNLCRWGWFMQWNTYQITMATKLFRPLTNHGMHRWRWYSPYK